MLATALPQGEVIPTVALDTAATPKRRPVDLSIEDEVLIEQAVERMTQLLIQGYVFVCAWSGGKDSSCVLVILINAMIRARQRGHTIPRCFVVTADTLLENPEVNEVKYDMLEAMEDYCTAHDFPLEIHVSRPSVMNTFQVQVIGGQTLPTYASSNSRQCSIDLKVVPNKRTLSKIKTTLSSDEADKLVTLLGSRMDESTVREARIREQGGSAVEVTTDKKGDKYFYPVVDFTQDTVWWCLARSGNESGKTWLSFTDNHDALAELYRESAGGECVVFQPDARDGDGIGKQKQGACGARHGCWACQCVDTDKSLAALVDLPENQWMKPLHVIREYIATLRYDWSKRRVGARSIDKHGYVQLAPNTLNFQTCSDLLRACLTADWDEKMRANVTALKLATGELEDTPRNRRMARPQFEIINTQMLLAIQWNWSVLGMEHKPFSALKIWQDVYKKYQRFYLPENPAPVPRTPVPKSRWLFVGGDWFQGNFKHGGIFDALGEFNTPNGDNCKYVGTDMKAKRTFYGEKVEVTKRVPYYEETLCLEFPLESAADFMDYEAERMVETFHDEEHYLPSMTASVFMRMGVVTLPYSKRSVYDMMLARARYFHDVGLHGDLTFEEVVAKGIGTDKDVKKQRLRQTRNRLRRGQRARAVA